MIPKPISPTDLRQNLYRVVREVSRTGRQYLVTPNDGNAVIIISREEYNSIVSERELLRDLRKAEADIEAGRTYTPSQVRAFLGRKRKPAAKKRTR